MCAYADPTTIIACTLSQIQAKASEEAAQAALAQAEHELVRLKSSVERDRAAILARRAQMLPVTRPAVETGRNQQGVTSDVMAPGDASKAVSSPFEGGDALAAGRGAVAVQPQTLQAAATSCSISKICSEQGGAETPAVIAIQDDSCPDKAAAAISLRPQHLQTFRQPGKSQSVVQSAPSASVTEENCQEEVEPCDTIPVGHDPGREPWFFQTLFWMLVDIVAVARGPERRAFFVAVVFAFFDQASASTSVINYARWAGWIVTIFCACLRAGSLRASISCQALHGCMGPASYCVWWLHKIAAGGLLV